MGSKVLAGGLTVAAAALLATNPVVVSAAGMITGDEIKNGTVTSADVANGSLLKKDLKAGVLPVGTQGYEIAKSAVHQNPSGTQSQASAFCPAGKVVVGGGVVTESEDVGAQAVSSTFPENATMWTAYVDNNTTTPLTFVVYAICVNQPASTPAARAKQRSALK